MKKFLSLFIFILVLSIIQSSYASNSEKENFENNIYTLKKDVWKNGEIYKTKVLNGLEKTKLKFSNDSRKLKLVDYTISQISKIQFKYGITNKNTPILYTYKFSDTFYGTGAGPVLDEYEQIDPVQSVLFSGTTVIIEDEFIDRDNVIYKIQLNEIPGYFDSYIDTRFLEIYDKQPSERNIIKLSKEEIINNLKLQVGHQYIRGGVMPTGVPELAQYYNSTANLPYYIENKLIIKGFDCSGLLHYATNGFTPRNTGGLVYYGSGLHISGLNSNEIIDKLEPLDIIVWRGHVMIVLDKDNLIESRVDYDTVAPGFDGGVRIRKIKPILDDLILNKIGVDNYDDKVSDGKKKFTIRRWYN